MQLELGRLIVT